jgi:hypothetical protein
MISPNLWCRTFMDKKLGGAVRRFQVVYRPGDRIVIRIERGPEFTGETEGYIRSLVARNLCVQAAVGFEYPAAIETKSSGKYSMVVNETRAQSASAGGG